MISLPLDSILQSSEKCKVAALVKTWKVLTRVQEDSNHMVEGVRSFTHPDRLTVMAKVE